MWELPPGLGLEASLRQLFTCTQSAIHRVGGKGDQESAQGDDGWEGGVPRSGSRKAVTSGAFPDNRESVPCNADRGPEGQWNIPLHTGSRGGSRRRSDPFNRKGRRNSKDNLGYIKKAFLGSAAVRRATSPP